MDLPNAKNAIIAEDKLAGYLLDLAHRRGGSKARLLESLSYKAHHWQRLADDLRQQHLTAEVIEQRDTICGRRYDIVAPLTGPSGDTIMFRIISYVSKNN
jgi:hypothetical protein